MKTLTCKDLGGPCDHKISGATFEDIGKAAYTHVMDQIKAGDQPHSEAANKMRSATPTDQMAMMASYRKVFDAA